MWYEELTHWERPWCWERLKAGEEGMMEDEIIGWHHWLNGHEFEQAPGVDNGQGSLVCCSPWDHKESDRTEWLNWLMTYMGFSGGLDGKESACNTGDLGSIPGSARSPGEGHGYHQVFLPGEFQGRRNLVRYSPWSHKESDMTEKLTHLTPAWWTWLFRSQSLVTSPPLSLNTTSTSCHIPLFHWPLCFSSDICALCGFKDFLRLLICLKSFLHSSLV